MAVVDFTKVADSDLIPKGEYDAFIFNAEEKEGSKAPYINLQLKIDGGPQDGRLAFHILSYSDANFCKVQMKQFLQAIGTNLDQPVDPTECAVRAIGKKLKITIGHEVDKESGDTRDRVTKMKPLDGAVAVGVSTITNAPAFR